MLQGGEEGAQGWEGGAEKLRAFIRAPFADRGITDTRARWSLYFDLSLVLVLFPRIDRASNLPGHAYANYPPFNTRANIFLPLDNPRVMPSRGSARGEVFSPRFYIIGHEVNQQMSR